MDYMTLRSRLFSRKDSKGLLIRTVLNYARANAFGVLAQGLHKGQLILQDTEGEHVFGTIKKGAEPVLLKVLNNNLWGKIFLAHDIGLAEAYMSGDFEVSSLKGLLDLWLDNRDSLAGLATTIGSLFAYYSALAINALFKQNLKASKWSAQVAYDVGNSFMQCFLSKDMMYSGALWNKEEHGPRGDITHGPFPGDLEAAQERKIQHFLKQARLRPGDRLLDIGCGWGSIAIAAARMGCTVDGITLSAEQKAFAEQRIREEGFAEKITIHLCDYRKLPKSFEHSFDACISCEMIEHVGHQFYKSYFGVIDWALKKDRGTVVISSTTQPESRYTIYQPEDFSRRYHWPNTHAPSPSRLIAAVQEAVHGRFVLFSVEDHGAHYCRTLREWGRRFEANFKGEVIEQLQEKYEFLRDAENLEAFKKKWLYMFVYAEVGFARAYTSLHQITWARPENIVEPCT